MCPLFASMDWLEFFQTLAAVGMFFIALTALNTWKHQSKAQKQTDFLDELTDTVHEYIQSLAGPIEILKIIRISMDSHKGLPSIEDHGEHSHVIAYIQRRGAEDASKLGEHLGHCNTLTSKINSLVVRGQAYDFKSFEKCINSKNMLTWQCQRLYVVVSLIGSPTLNWENPEVIKGVENMLTVEPTDIENHIKEYSALYINFVNENYRNVFSGT